MNYLINKLKQCHWIHTWSKWEEIGIPMIKSVGGIVVKEYTAPYRRRKCQSCGFIDERPL